MSKQGWLPNYRYNEVENGRRVGLATLPPSVSRLSRQCEILNISQPYRAPRPVTGQLYFVLLYPEYEDTRFLRNIRKALPKLHGATSQMMSST
jgi:hypothetical protein